MIASFSRALLDNLKKQMSDAEFDAALAKVTETICEASTHKV
jgi:fructose-bisphosphate aldolase class I